MALFFFPYNLWFTFNARNTMTHDFFLANQSVRRILYQCSPPAEAEAPSVVYDKRGLCGEEKYYGDYSDNELVYG